MERRHTPGPWLPAISTMKSLNIVSVGATYRCSVVGDDSGAMVATVHGRTEKECEANAIIIAANPDLLEALKDMLCEFDDETITDEIRTQIGLSANTVKALQRSRAAIAKAEGRS